MRHTLRSIAAAVLSAFVVMPASAQKISEVVASHVGTDDHEYIEIWGSANTSYSSLHVLEVDGGGVIQHAFVPGTTNGGGFWTTGYQTSTLEQPVFTVLLVSGFSGSVGADLDTNNDGTLDSTPWTSILDGVALSDGTAGLRTYTATVLGPNFDGVASAPGGASRFPYHRDTDAASDWKRNDFDGAGFVGFTGTLVTGEARNTPSWPTTVTLTDYYASVNASSAATLRTTLHALIGNHLKYQYSASTTDTWDILESADQDPNNSANILDGYKNLSIVKYHQGNTEYNREHSWPNSYGFPSDTLSPYTDCHHLFLTDISYNSARGNRPFVNCASGCTRYATVANDGYGGVSGPYPSDSNWQMGSDGNSGSWEVWSRRKGDIARAQLYMDVRYDGGTHPVTGTNETDLILTDNLSLVLGTSNSPAYMGRLTTILEWSAGDLPDDLERRRNDIVESYQGNRNPFIDHPEWAACIFQGVCSTCTASATVSGSASFCAGGSANISAALTGTGPWNLLWSDGFQQNGVASSPATRTVNPGVSTTYTVTTVSDATCTGTSSGSAVITVRPLPTATVTGTAPLCSGASATISAALTGTGPWNLLWSDGIQQNGVASSPATRSVTPFAETTYWVATITDAFCTGTSSGSATITPRSRPAATVLGTASVCAGGSTTISASLTGTAPWNLMWSDGVPQNGITSSPATRLVSPSTTTTYTLTSLSDAYCTGTATGSAIVTVRTLPTATVSGSTAICAGGSATISAALTGIGPWNVTWSDGFVQNGIPNSPTSRVVSPSSTTTYTVTSILDTYCLGTGTGSAVITVTPPAPGPGLGAPLDGSAGFQGSEISWTHDSNGPFDVYFDTVNPPQKRLVTTIRKKAKLPILFPGMTYYWKVVLPQVCGQPSSAVFSFQTGACPWAGTAPQLLAPVNGATGLLTSQTLSWQSVPGAAYYDVVLDTVNPPVRSYRRTNPWETTLDVRLNPGTTYNWKVVAYPICGSSSTASSAASSFSTAGAATVLTSSQPAFINRWSLTSPLSATGAGFLASSTLFLESGDGPAGAFAPAEFTSTTLSGNLTLTGTEPADFYDVGVKNTGVEAARLLQVLPIRAFTDVTESDWYFEASARIVEAGIMEPDVDPVTAGPQFEPNAMVTRAQMAEHLARSYQWWRTRSTVLEPAACATLDFPDVPCDHPDWLAIHWIKAWGVTTGSPCESGSGNCYYPNNSVNRAEIMTFLERLKQGAALPGLLVGLGEVDPGCVEAYPACSGWTDAGMKVPAWPRREFNVAFADRVTSGCGGVPGNGLTACVFDVLTRAQIGAVLARQLGLVPTP
jgi:endonuclease I